MACEKACKEGGARGNKAPLSAIHLAEQISDEADGATKGMNPQLVSEAKHMENALDRLANLLSDSTSEPDPANIHFVAILLLYLKKYLDIQYRLAKQLRKWLHINEHWKPNSRLPQLLSPHTHVQWEYHWHNH